MTRTVDPTALRTAPRAVTNVRSEPAGFVGRDADLATLAAHLDHSERLVSLVGPGGVGKTRLAREFALGALARGDFTEVWFCDVSYAADESGVYGALAALLGVPLHVGASGDAALTPLVRALAHRGRTLLIVDNFEHLVGPAATVPALLVERADDLRVLVTSRQRLRLRREHVIELEPLAVPRPGEVSTDAPSVQLFLDRAAQAGADAYGPDDLVAVADIARRLEGLPLALELAAARTTVLSPRELSARLASSLSLLDHAPGPRDANDRQATLHNTLAWSWNLLDSAARQALAQACVFRGGFTMAAAEAVLALAGGASVFHALEALRDGSLVRVEPATGPDGASRFALYAVVREFAAGYRTGPEIFATATRHARYFLESAETAGRQLESVDAEGALAWFGSERDNLLAVIDRSLAVPPSCDLPAAGPLRLLLALDGLLMFRGPFHGHRDLLDRALDRALRAPLDPGLHARALLALAQIARRTGDLPTGHAAIDAALGLLRTSPDPALEGCVLRSRAGLHLLAGDVQRAEAVAREALQRSRDADDRWTEGMAMCTLGTALREQGHLDEAQAWLERAVALNRQNGNARYAAVAAGDLGIVFQEFGDLVRARSHAEEALAAHRSFDSALFEAIERANLAAISHAEGNLDETEMHLGAARVLLRTVGSPRYDGLYRMYEALVLRERGHRADAVVALEQAHRQLLDAHDDRNAALARAHLAGALADCGDIDEAVRHAEAAAGGLDPRDPLTAVAAIERAHVDVARGAAARALGQLREARSWLEKAKSEVDAVTQGSAAPLERCIDARIARRIFDGALARVRAVQHAERPGSDAEPSIGPTLVMHAGGDWFQLPAGPRIDCARRRTVRRVLACLVDARVRSPGSHLSTERLMDAGWPGERMLASAATNRLHVMLTTLRNLGLREVLCVDDRGYFLDPDVPLRVVQA